MEDRWEKDGGGAEVGGEAAEGGQGAPGSARGGCDNHAKRFLVHGRIRQLQGGIPCADQIQGREDQASNNRRGGSHTKRGPWIWCGDINQPVGIVLDAEVWYVEKGAE